MNAQETFIPINNSCERGLRAALRSYLLGRNVNGGRCPVEPDARVKLTVEQRVWLNTVCDHDWPEYQATLRHYFDNHGRGVVDEQLWAWLDHTKVENQWPGAHAGRDYPVRKLQELLNRLDEFRDARDAAEFDADCRARGIGAAGALNTPHGRSIVQTARAEIAARRDPGRECSGALVGAAGHETVDAHRYGTLAEDTAVVRPSAHTCECDEARDTCNACGKGYV